MRNVKFHLLNITTIFCTKWHFLILTYCIPYSLTRERPLKDNLYVSNSAMMLTKNSPWTYDFNAVIAQIRAGGLIQYYWDKPLPLQLTLGVNFINVFARFFRTNVHFSSYILALAPKFCTKNVSINIDEIESRCQFHQHFYVQIFCMNIVSAAFSSYVLALAKNSYKKHAQKKRWWNWP